ncbi:PAS domain-containing sensor histidine kinase [Roseovarius salinarum]|uniref:PAS domain-containing sensor histidine kinase n=1 Tax=Roseovarius salinarum TaxID=1981892 RepID=UPI000C33977F|nr:ATP-binding protein [Roseovarius salinarum]
MWLASGIATGIGIIIITVLFLAYLRSREAAQLRKKLLQGQRLELAFQERALNEHSLVTVTDTNGVIRDVNEGFLKTFGYTRDQVIGRLHRDLHPEWDRQTSDRIRRVTRRGEIWSGDTYLLRGDGSVATTQCTVVPMVDESRRHVKNITMRTDVTEQREQDAQELMKAAFGKLSAFAIICKPHSGRVCYINDVALEQMGWDRAESATKTIRDMGFDLDALRLAEIGQELIENPDRSMTLDLSRNGRFYEAQLYTLFMGQGQPRILAIVRDVSQTKEAEREKKELLSVITHELRTPLTNIKGSLGLVRSGQVGEMSREISDLVGIAESNSERMLSLVNDLLDIEKIAAEGGCTDPEPVDIPTLLDDVVRSHQGYGVELDVSFQDLTRETGLKVMGDYRRLSQVLSNLMSNAAKFSHQGGNVELKATSDGKDVEISVRDYGPGIPEDAQATLFDRFKQARQPGNSKVNASGLGLSIARDIVEHHGGTITFSTQHGKGTTFYVLLPRLTADTIEAPARPRQSRAIPAPAPELALGGTEASK